MNVKESGSHDVWNVSISLSSIILTIEPESLALFRKTSIFWQDDVCLLPRCAICTLRLALGAYAFRAPSMSAMIFARL